MRNNSSTFFIILFLFLAFGMKSSMSGIFIIMAIFFFVKSRVDKKQNKQQDRYERRRETHGERPRTDRRTDRTPERRTQYKKRENPFKKSGIRKYKEYDLDDAIIDFNKGLEVDPSDMALHFNIACAYSLTEQKEKAYHHLKKCVEYGFKDFEKIQTHDDLAYVRIQPEYDAFKLSGFTTLSGEDGQSQKSIEQPEEVKDDVLLSQLNKLAELRKKGLLSEQEFSYERKKLLSR